MPSRHMQFYATHILCPEHYARILWRDIGHKALCPISPFAVLEEQLPPFSCFSLPFLFLSPGAASAGHIVCLPQLQRRHSRSRWAASSPPIVHSELPRIGECRMVNPWVNPECILSNTTSQITISELRMRDPLLVYALVRTRTRVRCMCYAWGMIECEG